MTYMVGDVVNVIGMGTGAVREVLNRGRFRVDVKGRTLIATSAQLTRAETRRPRRKAQRSSVAAQALAPESTERPAHVRSLDLHGRTVPEAILDVQDFLNMAILSGDAEVRIIHGRSGGRIKSAVHAQLKGMAVRSVRLDPRNPGVTIVIL